MYVFAYIYLFYLTIKSGMKPQLQQTLSTLFTILFIFKGAHDYASRN